MLRKIFKIALFVGAVAPLLLSAWFSFEFYLPHRTSPQEIFFFVEPGKSVQNIAQNLKEKGIIKKRWPFLFGYKFFFFAKSLKAGEYVFQLPLSTK
ncbi:MAG: hypothetical protein H8E54_03960, partial [Candidatus Aminicenantes bacterium]|nr:hypothetical protein [Candidatus Aminicenantes bacterium]